jgi:hypothetical protein
MRRIVVGITALKQHVDAVKGSPERYRPRCCPHCGIKNLWRHGHYERKAGRQLEDRSLNPVLICRYRCTGCRRTCSRLPECIAPRRWYDWSVQQAALGRRLTGCPEGSCADCGGPDERTVDRWWQWLKMRSELFEFHLRARFAELGRAAGFGAFWRRVFATLGLARAMAILDHEISVP